MPIKSSKESVDDAVRQLQKYQSGEEKPVLTRFGHLNDKLLGGLYKDMMITIAAISGGGKSYFLQLIEEDIFNKELNPTCDDFALIRCNWEMSTFKLILRRLSRELQVPIKKLLSKPFSASEIAIAKTVMQSERNPNIFYLDQPTDYAEFYNTLALKLEELKDKKHIFISIDHIALAKGSDLKRKIDDTLATINDLKQMDKRLTFFAISQMNRSIEGRTSPTEMSPRRSDIYASDGIWHLSDAVLALHNPYRLGIQEYMRVSSNRYQYLDEHFVEQVYDKDDWVSFSTENKIFYHYLKVRELDNDMRDIYVENMSFNKMIKVENEHNFKDEKIFG